MNSHTSLSKLAGLATVQLLHTLAPADMSFSKQTMAAGFAGFHDHMPAEWSDREVPVMSGGAVAEDFNGDGWLDLYYLSGETAPNRLYINQGNGTFIDEAAAWGVDLTHNGYGVCAADYDNDGDIDMVITVRDDRAVLLVNEGNQTFRHETIFNAGFTQMFSPSFGDFDNDGRLDLLLGRWTSQTGSCWLYRARPDGGFSLHTTFAVGHVYSPRFADLNGDGLQDIPIAADFGKSALFMNLGGGAFQHVTMQAHVGTDENGMGSAIGDYDNDGDLDWFVTSIFDDSGTVEGNWGTTGNRLYRNEGGGVFTDATTHSGTREGFWGWGASFGDLDNDGHLDLYHVNGFAAGSNNSSPGQHLALDRKFNNQPALLFHNNGDGSFTERATASGAADTGQGRGVIVADFDNDGDLDIFICNNQEYIVSNTGAAQNLPGKPTYLRNDTQNDNRWLKVTLAGTPPLHRHGIGSRVYVTTGDSMQMRELHASTNYLAQEPGRIAHFGVGPHDKVDEIRALWVGGNETMKYNVPSNADVVLRSLASTIPRRTYLAGEPVIADGAAVEPSGTPRHWLVGGKQHADPLSAPIHAAGEHVIELVVMDQAGEVRAAGERFTVTVLESTSSLLLY